MPPADANSLRGQVGRLFAIDPIDYAKEPMSDTQGRIRFPALIPGASYQIVDRTGVPGPSGSRVRKSFRVKPGETLDVVNLDRKAATMTDPMTDSRIFVPDDSRTRIVCQLRPATRFVRGVPPPPALRVPAFGGPDCCYLAIRRTKWDK